MFLCGDLPVLDYFYTMKFLMALFLALTIGYAEAQDSIACYFNEQLLPVDKRRAVYNGKMIQTPEGWNAVAYNAGGQLLMQGTYKDKKLQVRHGVYNIYNTNGTLRMSAVFEDNIVNGPYQSWHENGQLADSGRISHNMKTGLWRTWYPDGVLESEGSYTDAVMEGEWKWFRENGKPATVELYVNGKIKDLACYDATGTHTGFNCRIDKKPCPKNEYSFESFVIENLEYPNEALRKGIEGVVNFEFIITREGKLTRVNFTNKSDKILQDAIVAFLKSVTEWEPAISHNREVDCVYSYQVPFYLP